MKLTYNWIKDYVDLTVSPGKLADGLTMSGSEVGSIEEVNGDKVMEMEITSNRPDCLNMIGLAREVSAVFDLDLKLPSFEVISGNTFLSEIECEIKAKDLCLYYSGRVIKDVSVSDGSGKVCDMITALGMRSVNNIVDITNFCLMESGQPLHAFDLDKLEGKKIVVREALKGEKITTIDGVERELEPGMLIIADVKKPVAIAGVMGGVDTEVTNGTKNILLESAYFDPLSIRSTARKLAISTDSSYRFERGVDKGMVKKASDRAAAMIAESSGGKITDLYEAGEINIGKTVINLDVNKTSRILGVKLDKDTIKNILKKTGMIVKDENAFLSVSVPSFREDVKEDVDLVEEVARIYGYHNIPGTLPQIFPAVERKGFKRLAKEKLRDKVVGSGFNEVMTYSLISDVSAGKFESFAMNKVTLSNPLSEEQKVLTPHLFDGMMKSVSWNINRKNMDLALFEIGKIYASGRKDYKEIDTICLALTGDIRKNWSEGSRKASFYDLKGVVEMIFGELGISLSFRPSRKGELVPCAEIRGHGQDTAAGYIGQVSNNILKDYGIEQEVFICQIMLNDILRGAILDNKYKPVPKFPFSTRDISILCKNETGYSRIASIIGSLDEEIVRSVDLVDVFTGKNISDGMKSLTVSVCYGLDSRTLTDEEIGTVHDRIKDTIADKLGVTFR